MCGRYSFAPKPKQLTTQIPGLIIPEQLEISYNIAPTHLAYVITQSEHCLLQKFQWGLVPHWSTDGKNSGKLINARVETIAEKPSFRDSFSLRRCLVPADSFYEWRKEPGGKKAPYRIAQKDGGLIFMAGIWDEWQKGDTQLRSFSIITCPANLDMAELHNRMPVILPDLATQLSWLSGEKGQEILQPLANDRLSMYRVSDALNKPGLDDVSLHVEVEGPWLLF